MKPWRLFLGLAASALPSGLAAQDNEGELHPTPPPVMPQRVSPPPILVPPAIASDDPALIEYRQSCGGAGASIPFGGPSGRAVFLTERSPARLILCNDRFRTGVPAELDSIDVALAFMAYKPFKPFWKAAEERWGKALEKLRAELRERALAMTSEGNSYRDMVSGGTARAINKAHALSALGYYAEAQARLDEALERLGRRAEDTDEYNFDIALVAITAAGMQTRRVGPQAASDLLGKFGEAGLTEKDTINLNINHAAYLAESGHYRAALDLLLPAYEAFRESEIEDGSYRISGSNREFSWILACAYRGVGNEKRANDYIAIVDTADEFPADPYLESTKRSTDIRFRMNLCMDDQKGYFAVWRSIGEPFLSYNWLAFQKAGGMVWVGGVRREWIADHPDARQIAHDYRQLPDRYTPALHRWQDSPKSGN